MCKKLDPWKFTSDNYSIVWRSPESTTHYYTFDDDPEDRQFDFNGICVNQNLVCACWDNKDCRDMAMTPHMITVHVTICREEWNYMRGRDLMMNETFQLPVDSILRNHLIVFSEHVTSPRYISAIKIKIAIPINNQPSIEAYYCDPDGDVHDVEKTLLGENTKYDLNQKQRELNDLASDIEAIRKIRAIIPKMDGYWKDYVQEIYPDLYDSFEKTLLKSMEIIKSSADSAASASDLAGKKKSARELIMPEVNVDILCMVSYGMVIYNREIARFTDSECEAVLEAMNSVTPEDFEEMKLIKKENEKINSADDKVLSELREETKDNPLFNYNNYEPQGHTVPGWAVDNTKEGFAQVKPEYKDLFPDKKTDNVIE